ncbi:hypothetical protein LTS10_010744 [Elasticomyces elasticus]|nr:hypothetical protein LTS10_010744 [Elasticomyces elasticus]
MSVTKSFSGSSQARRKGHTFGTAPARCEACGASTDNCQQNFPYLPLRETSSQFRLLRLVYDRRRELQHNDEGTELIEIELIVHSHHDPLQYQALSYCWGTDEPTFLIRLGEKPFYVRRNRYTFLKQMRDEQQEGPFFVDAICINQHDIRERASQVRLMADIYGKAEEVVAWLGTDGEGWFKDFSTKDSSLHRVLQVLTGMLSKWRELESEDLPPFHSYVAAEGPAELRNGQFFFNWNGLDFFRVQWGLSEFDLPSWSSLGSEEQESEILWQQYASVFCDNVYWSRMWIVQEIVLARKVTVRWSSCSVAVESLELLLGRLLGYTTQTITKDFIEQMLHSRNWLETDPGSSMDSPYSQLKLLAVYRLLQRRRELQQQAPNNRYIGLPAALTEFGNRGCSRIHDKVFALRGLTRSLVKVDYEVTVHELFVRTFFQAMLENQIKRRSDELGPEGTPRRWQEQSNFLMAIVDTFDLHITDLTTHFLLRQLYDWYGVECDIRIIAKLMWSRNHTLGLGRYAGAFGQLLWKLTGLYSTLHCYVTHLVVRVGSLLGWNVLFPRGLIGAQNYREWRIVLERLWLETIGGVIAVEAGSEGLVISSSHQNTMTAIHMQDLNLVALEVLEMSADTLTGAAERLKDVMLDLWVWSECVIACGPEGVRSFVREEEHFNAVMNLATDITSEISAVLKGNACSREDRALLSPNLERIQCQRSLLMSFSETMTDREQALRVLMVVNNKVEKRTGGFELLRKYSVAARRG